MTNNLGSINLIYAVTGNGNGSSIHPKIWKQIEEVQEQYNLRFTWTADGPSLALQKPEMGKFRLNLPFSLSRFITPQSLETVATSGHLPYEGGMFIPNALAYGQTKTRDNLWNAHLVVRFLRWVSEQLPELRVEIYDEGGFILAGSAVIERGKIHLNKSYLERMRSRLLEAYGDPMVTVGLAHAELEGMNGKFFADTVAYEYREVPEIREILENNPELVDESLASLASRSFVMAQEIPTAAQPV